MEKYHVDVTYRVREMMQRYSVQPQIHANLLEIAIHACPSMSR